MRRMILVSALVMGAALLAVTVATGGGAAGPPDGNGLDRAIAVQDAHTEELLNIQGVGGTGVGLGADGQPVIVIYTVAAGVAGLPSSLDGVPVDVVVTGLIVARGCQENDDPKDRCDRPVPIGVSTGHPRITAGTIAARVTDGTNVFALSNNHVYANTNDANIGDQALQPGPADGGRKGRDQIGELFAFEIIVFDFSDCTDDDPNTVCDTNTIDAAIAISSTDLLGNATLPAGYGTPNSSTLPASPDLLVQKCGRTTGCTQGTVSAVNVTVDICYKPVGPGFCFTDGIARFVDQFSVAGGDFSAGGDSGSLIVTNDVNTNPVGLLFAGSSTTTFANPIDPVLGAFGVTIDDGAPATDTTGPTVTAVDPANLATGAAVASNVTVTFSEPVNGVTDTSFTLTLRSDGSNIAGTVAVAADRQSATFDPTDPLPENAAIDVKVDTTVTDDSGNNLDQDPNTAGDQPFTSSFATGTAPVPGAAPVVDSCTPTNASPGQRLTVEVTGSNFQDGATVDFGERVMVQDVTFVSPSQLDVKIKVHPKAALGPRDVTVVNPGGQSGTNVGCFTVN